MQLRPARLVGAPALALSVSLAGCSSVAGPEAAPTAARAAAPELSAVLYQSRMDLDDRQVQVKVRNEGDADVVVERMTLSSTAFDEPMVYRKRGSTVPDGRAVDMPVVLSDPVCDGTSRQHTVTVDYRLGDGSTGTVEFPAVDEHGAVARLHEGECFALDVAEVASLSVRGQPRLVARDGALTAELLVDVNATGGDADLQVLQVSNTTLLTHIEPATLEPLPEGRAVGLHAPDSGTETFTLTLVPSRCDAHAVAEDKQGTRFRVLVDLDGWQGTVPLVSPDPVRVALYDFVRQACGELGGPDG